MSQRCTDSHTSHLTMTNVSSKDMASALVTLALLMVQLTAIQLMDMLTISSSVVLAHVARSPVMECYVSRRPRTSGATMTMVRGTSDSDLSSTAMTRRAAEKHVLSTHSLRFSTMAGVLAITATVTPWIRIIRDQIKTVVKLMRMATVLEEDGLTQSILTTDT